MHKLVLLEKEMALKGKALNAAEGTAGPSINNLQTQASEPSEGSSSFSIECLACRRHSGHYTSQVNKWALSSEKLSLKLAPEGHARNWQQLLALEREAGSEKRRREIYFLPYILLLLLNWVPLVMKKVSYIF